MSLVAPLQDSEISVGLVFFVFGKNSSALDVLGLRKCYPSSNTVLGGGTSRAIWPQDEWALSREDTHETKF